MKKVADYSSAHFSDAVVLSVAALIELLIGMVPHHF